MFLLTFALNKRVRVPRAMTEFGGMHLFDNLNKTAVVFSGSEVEELEAAVRTIVEATSWMGWWTYSAKSLTLMDSLEAMNVKHLFVPGTFWQLLVTQMASTVWADHLLKC